MNVLRFLFNSELNMSILNSWTLIWELSAAVRTNYFMAPFFKWTIPLDLMLDLTYSACDLLASVLAFYILDWSCYLCWCCVLIRPFLSHSFAGKQTSLFVTIPLFIFLTHRPLQPLSWCPAAPLGVIHPPETLVSVGSALPLAARFTNQFREKHKNS